MLQQSVVRGKLESLGKLESISACRAEEPSFFLPIAATSEQNNFAELASAVDKFLCVCLVVALGALRCCLDGGDWRPGHGAP